MEYCCLVQMMLESGGLFLELVSVGNAGMLASPFYISSGSFIYTVPVISCGMEIRD